MSSRSKSIRRGQMSSMPIKDNFSGDMDPDLLPCRLYATDQYNSKGRINSYSKPEYLLDLVSAMEGTREYNYLRASYFKSLFDIPARKSCLSGKLVHQMVSRSLITQKKHELWFVFGGKPFRFSLREFGLVMGLNCAPYPPKKTILKWQTPENPKKSYWNTLFSEEKSIVLIKDIIIWLKRDKRVCAEKKMPGWKRLQLSLIVIVEGILICNTGVVKASKQAVEMVKDLFGLFW